MPIKYIGSKRTLLPAIVAAVRGLAASGTVLDLFSGTSRVGHAFKRAGFRVAANDHNAYAHCLADCYVAADLEDVELGPGADVDHREGPGADGLLVGDRGVEHLFVELHEPGGVVGDDRNVVDAVEEHVLIIAWHRPDRRRCEPAQA